MSSTRRLTSWPTRSSDPAGPARLDWEATLAYRRHLWSWGLGVAEAMDTAQRGMGLDWPAAAELIRRSAAEARAVGGLIACGAGTDQLPPGERASLDEIRAAYLEQLELDRGRGQPGHPDGQPGPRRGGARARGLPRRLRPPARTGRRPVILHWLGEMFDPALAGYWGGTDTDDAARLVLELIADHAERIDGIKVSLLDADRERALRLALPDGVRLYTGDDFNYPELIRGDGGRHSDALLGVFDAIAPAASAALQALDAGDPARFDATLAPTLPLARALFSAAHLQLQDRHRLPGLARWPSGPLQDGRRPRERALGGAPERALPAGRPGRAAAAPGPERGAHAPAAGAGRGRPVSAAAPLADLSRVSLNQITADQLTLEQAVEGCAAAGLPWIGVWRHKLEGGAQRAGRLVAEAGLRVSSLCRGGFFSAADSAGRREREADNRRALEEAAALGTDVLVLVCGPAADGDLEAARRTVLEGIERLVPHAAEAGIRLGIEPLHPMMIAERSVVVTLGQANDLAERFDPAHVGVVVDAYHVWWDPALERELARSAGRIVGYHVSDWLSPTGTCWPGGA